MRHGKNINFTRVVVTLALIGHLHNLFSLVAQYINKKLDFNIFKCGFSSFSKELIANVDNITPLNSPEAFICLAVKTKSKNSRAISDALRREGNGEWT